MAKQPTGKFGALTESDKTMQHADPPRMLSTIPVSEKNEIAAGVKHLRRAVKLHAAHEFHSGHETGMDWGERRRQQLALEALRNLGESTLAMAKLCYKVPSSKL